MPTLREALDQTWETRWRHMRSGPCLKSQAEIAARTVGETATAANLPFAPTAMGHWEAVPVSAILEPHLRHVTGLWYARGISPATITKRLNCLSVLGVDVKGHRVKGPRPLKWWLNPEDHKRLTEWLRSVTAYEVANAADVADFIDWTVYTGLRVEESLRLTWRDVGNSGGGATDMWVSVPGTKTAMSQATLPLAMEAVAVLRDRPYPAKTSDHVFPISYDALHHAWQKCREFLGVQDVPTATLKALRRSAARHLHITKGMPLDMVREYLRHEDVKTTMGYLRLTGGYGEKEMRRWL